MAGILVVAEQLKGELRDVSFELVGAASELKARVGGPLQVLLVGDDMQGAAPRLNLPGVDKVLVAAVDAPHFDALVFEEVVCRVAAQEQARAVLLPHSVNGMASAAAIAARLGAGFASDVFGLDEDGGEIVATRSGYGGKVQIEVSFPGKPVVVLALRGATFAKPEGAGSAAIESRAVDVSGVAQRATHLEYREAPPADFDISKSDFLLSIGRGVGEGDKVPRFKTLAERVGATLSCSRPVADAGWLPKPHQVGQSGKVAASCKLYLALGISGAVQHLFGMKHIETIIAVNTDPDAPIFKYAHYGVCIDLFEFADALEKQFN
ncbi:MAG TPA: electron transfer flavoprotein subunit alpha/FixB family protein [Alphaproteobacteria bacterium]|nr:electron transfer flavoprotein subunit alpha/FixB family protein [Alphaproteobacteria bacterium]